MRCRASLTGVLAAAALSACSVRQQAPDEHAQHEATSGGNVALSTQPGTSLPPSSANVKTRLDASPRHAEWAVIRDGSDSVRAYVVYPERKDKAPVVVVIHEIFGLSTWIRGVADQLAADGFIAIAPDLLTGKVPLDGDTATNAAARSAIATLKPDDVHRQLAAVAKYGMSLPAALPKYGIVGFCWGGSASFAHAVRSLEGLGASVVYYGSSPPTADLSRVKVPVLGLYGGNDARVNATIPPADSAMKALGKAFEPHIFEGAGHGFLRAQGTSQDTTIAAANVTATQKAWPLTISFFRKHLGA
ncbi:MAG TPA: dienelactone hydrolase family protein [Gemmatimonadaceae bacterium]|nr:dienelactone hydrolase family protein [Gemmatimonadaceae bacterium]